MGLRISKPYSLLPREETNPKPSIFLLQDIIEEILYELPVKPLQWLSETLNRKITASMALRNPRPSIFIPEDIVEEIIYGLPVKSLWKFRCVSKSWRSLIDSKQFIEIHYRKNYPTEYEKVLIVYDYFNSDDPHGSSGLQQGSIMVRSHSGFLPFDDPINNHLMTGRIAGIRDGLLCILKQGCFFLWNPAIRIAVELPKIDNVIKKYGLGWDEKSDAYKVFAAVSDQSQTIGKVYSSRTNSWKTVQHGGCLALSGRAGLSLGGKIYWVMESGDELEWFDLESEEFGRINLPRKLENASVTLEKCRCRCRCGLLMCVYYSLTRKDLWIMKQGSWVLWSSVSSENKPQGQGRTTLMMPTSSTTEADNDTTDENIDPYEAYFYAESLVSPLAMLT